MLNLTKSLAVKPTKQKLEEIITYWNRNVGGLRNSFLDGLNNLNVAKENSDSKELSESFTKLSEQSDRIFTHFPNSLGSKIAVKLGKNTKRLNLIRTSLS